MQGSYGTTVNKKYCSLFTGVPAKLGQHGACWVCNALTGYVSYGWVCTVLAGSVRYWLGLHGTG